MEVILKRDKLPLITYQRQSRTDVRRWRHRAGDLCCRESLAPQHRYFATTDDTPVDWHGNVTAPNTLSRKYLATIGIAAVLILGLGLVARIAINGRDTAPPAAPSESFTLERLSQENQLLDISAFIEKRVDAAAPLVVRVPSFNAAGIRWGARDTIVTTSPLRPVFVAVSHVPDTLRPAVDTTAPRSARGWLFVVGRDKDGRVISWQGISGGVTTTACGTNHIDAYVLGFIPGSGFAGAGVFDLAGQLQGMVVNCGSELVPIPRAEMLRLMADTASVNVLTDSADSARVHAAGSPRMRAPKRRR